MSTTNSDPVVSASRSPFSGKLLFKSPALWQVQFGSVDSAADAVAGFWRAVSPWMVQEITGYSHTELLQELSDRGLDLRTDGGAELRIDRATSKLVWSVSTEPTVHFKAANGERMTREALCWLEAQNFNGG